MKQLKYDYSELEEYMEKDYPERTYMATQFFKLYEGYMKMATFILAGNQEIQGHLTVDPEAADFTGSFMTIFEILGRLPEVKED